VYSLLKWTRSQKCLPSTSANFFVIHSTARLLHMLKQQRRSGGKRKGSDVSTLLCHPLVSTVSAAAEWRSGGKRSPVFSHKVDPHSEGFRLFVVIS
jgi:hypothetical protein